MKAMSTHSYTAGAVRAAVIETLESRQLLSFNVPSDYELVESKTISATSSAVNYFTDALKSGAQYIITAEGTAKIGDRTDKGGPRNTDAVKFDDLTETDVFSKSQPARLLLSGVSASGWGSYDASHIYGQQVTGTGARLGVKFNDLFLTDNDGALSVGLYRRVPTVTIEPATTSNEPIEEGQSDVAAFKVKRTLGDGALSVAIRVNNVVPGAGIATAVDDFTTNPAITGGNNDDVTVEFANGETEKTIYLSAKTDQLVEGNETVDALLYDGYGTDGYEIGSPSSATITIKDTSIVLGNLTVEDVSNPANQAVASTATPVHLHIGESASGDAKIQIKAAFTPNTSEAGERVLFIVTGNAVSGVGGSGSSGNFAGNDPIRTLTPANNNSRDFVVKVGIDDDADGILDSAEVSREVVVHIVGAVLEVLNPLISLTQDSTLNASLGQGSGTATATNFKYEIRFANSSDWYELASANTGSITNVARVAGTFKLRVSATFGGSTLVSSERDLTVQFPNGAEIQAGANAKSLMDGAWQATVSDTQPTLRREHGYWVQLDTSKGARGVYELVAPSDNPWVRNDEGAVSFSSDQPADSADITPVSSPTYIVSFFHTHTATFYRTEADMRSYPRRVGPSDDDLWQANNNVHMPGLVYDYVEDAPGSKTIKWGHLLYAPAKIYEFGPERRATP